MHLCLTVECITSSLHFCSIVCLFLYQFISIFLAPPPPAFLDAVLYDSAPKNTQMHTCSRFSL